MKPAWTWWWGEEEYDRGDVDADTARPADQSPGDHADDASSADAAGPPAPERIVAIDESKLPYLTPFHSALKATGFVHRAGIMPRDHVQITARVLAMDALLLRGELGY